jgi:hypothetical protein
LRACRKPSDARSVAVTDVEAKLSADLGMLEQVLRGDQEVGAEPSAA